MNHNINQNLIDLAVDVSLLDPLPGNPRIGNVDAIMASYSQFGQLKPIVIKEQEDGRYVVVAGNHQLQAVKKLGWSHVAAVKMEGETSEALAFALVDNRVADLGKTDPELLNAALNDVVYDFPELFDAVGWDEYEVAAIGTEVDESYSSINANGAAGAYIPPVLMDPAPVMDTVRQEDGSDRYVAPAGMDQKLAVAGGSGTTGNSGSKQAVFSYNVVFDDHEQMSRWWDFLKWLRANPGYDGDTIAQKITSFIDAHSEV
jgi:hypothetical protein